jgi:hypothetical protein
MALTLDWPTPALLLSISRTPSSPKTIVWVSAPGYRNADVGLGPCSQGCSWTGSYEIAEEEAGRVDLGTLRCYAGKLSRLHRIHSVGKGTAEGFPTQG